MELYIIRHGQSENNALGGDQSNRVKDPALTKLGQSQAENVARHLVEDVHPEMTLFSASAEGSAWEERQGYGIDKLYCSAMLRALQTARPISQALGVSPEVWVDIHEMGGIYLADEHGVERGYSGMTRGEILEQFPDYILPETITGAGWWNRGRETREQCQGRAIGVAAQLQMWPHPEDRIALVSHAGFIGALIKALLNQLPGDGILYNHYNTAITHIDFLANGKLQIRYLNRTNHLTSNMISA